MKIERNVDLRVPAWLRWTGSLLSLATGVIVGAISGKVTVAVGVGIAMFTIERLFANAGATQGSGRQMLRIEPGRIRAQADFPLVSASSRLAIPQIVKGEEGLVLRFRTRFRIIDIEVKDEEDAKAIVEAIGATDPPRVSGYVWTMPLPNFTELGFLAVIPIGLVLAASLYWPAALAALACVSTLITLAAVTLRLYRAEVEIGIGRDGLALHRGLAPPRFIRYTELASVRAEQAELWFELAGGERLRFSTTLESEPTEDDRAQARAIAARIEKNRVASAELPAAPAETPGLLRGTRTSKEWLAALRKIGEGGDSAFRDAAPPRDQLWQIIESVDAPALERIAAAVALKASGLATEEIPRLRVAAEGAAEPKLGDRLRVVSEKEEEALAEVLEEAQKEET